MKSLEVWRKGYKAEFSPGLGRSKCKVSPLPCLPWDSVGGVGQGQFCILHKSGIDSPVLWRSPGLSSGRVCWDCWQYGRSAWALALSGVQAGRRSFYCHFLAVPLSLPLSRLSFLSLPPPGRRWLCCLAGWGIASAGGGWVSLCPHAGLGCWAGSPGCRCWLLSSPCLASSPSPGCWLWGLALLSPSVLSPGCWRSSAVLWCWPAMRWGWVLALGGVGAGLSRPWRWWLAGAGVR